MFNEDDDFERFEGDDLPQRLGQLLMNMDGVRDMLIENSINILRDPKFQMEYALDATISVQNKVDDIDELIAWAVEREMYEDCALMVKLKERIIETIDIQSVVN